ncbi:dual specificity protein phosphatase 15-like isoform X2 [Phymastichus coffea]|uniref:dual specificity protein phosphatase 15-like isoform X2 n=1 Tax=Phymastichus coffea TaxID=108790 RepID=UPI00273C611A|nr:dual specificity protein phosphatase 15-like isoform X2 [Phymastichus coffea]
MGNGMNKVLPGLYVGNYRDSKDAAQLERFEITHILAIHDAARRLHSDKHYLCILAADSPDQNLSQYFPICNDFIHSARLRGGNVLIHCLAGMSRSVTLAVAYIMSTTDLSWKDALKVVRVGRAVANPNVGFQQQLEDFESTRLQDVGAAAAARALPVARPRQPGRRGLPPDAAQLRGPGAEPRGLRGQVRAGPRLPHGPLPAAGQARGAPQVLGRRRPDAGPHAAGHAAAAALRAALARAGAALGQRRGRLGRAALLRRPQRPALLHRLRARLQGRLAAGPVGGGRLQQQRRRRRQHVQPVGDRPLGAGQQSRDGPLALALRRGLGARHAARHAARLAAALAPAPAPRHPRRQGRGLRADDVAPAGAARHPGTDAARAPSARP